MPLSDHEQRLLEQMERQLYADDPKLASTLRGSGRALRSRQRVIIGALAIVVGLALLVAGVAAPFWPLGVVGFLVMLGGGWWASAAWQSGATGSTTSARPAKGGPSPARPGFMSRIEERWERRRDGDR